MMTTTIPSLQTCQWCGFYHTGICPMATAIEYYPNGSVKRVEFGQRQTLCPGATTTQQFWQQIQERPEDGRRQHQPIRQLYQPPT